MATIIATTAIFLLAVILLGLGTWLFGRHLSASCGGSSGGACARCIRPCARKQRMHQ